MKMPSNFDLRALEVFVTTADQGGMTQCAKVLSMTQSAVSQTIASLEGAIGVKLFDRSVRPIILTSAGRILLERGQQILKDTKEAYHETRTLERSRLASLTIAMTDSMAVVLGPHLYEQLNEISSHWRLWGGLSPYHREEFMSRNIDLIITTSYVMDDVSGLSRYKVFQEPYVSIFPKGYKGDVDFYSGEKDLPFLRISMRSAMGLRVERQLHRLNLSFPEVAEFDRAPAHILAIAKGMGWGVTTPLCLLESPQLLEQIDVYPITNGAFSRHFDLLSWKDHLGDIPEMVAKETGRILKTDCLPTLYSQMPWLEDMIALNNR